MEYMTKNMIWAIANVYNHADIVSKVYSLDATLLREWGVNVIQSSIPKVVITKWKKPLVGWYKLNVDGYPKGNPSLSGRGALLRSANGNC